MRWKTSVLSFLIALSQIVIIPFAAHAGGGCGSDTPRISTDFVKPGQTFDVITNYVMYDVSPSLYQDPNYIPYVTFSNSIPWLSKSSQFLGATTEGANYKATFQVPLDFKGNMQLQAIVFNICGSPGNQGTYGPRVIIQSDSSIPTCRIESVRVSDYSVDVGESFKVAFKIYSDVENIQPSVELTEYKQVTSFPARLVGTSTSSSLRIFEATVNYKQARQYNYGAIARPEVKNLCNASGERDVIGIMGYITSMAMMKPITKSAECNNGSQPVSALDYLGVVEKLICANYPVGSIRYSWRTADDLVSESTPTTPTSDPCTREGATKTACGQTFVCADTGSSINFVPAGEAEKLISAKKKMSEIYAQSSNLIFRLKSAFSSVESTQLKLLVQNLIKDLSAFEIFYKRNEKTSFDFPGAGTELQVLNLQADTIFKLISKEKITIACVKGKLSKNVTAVKPVCPTGYKKK